MSAFTDKAMGLVRAAITVNKRLLAQVAPGSQDEADVTEVLATLEPLALKFPAPKPAVPEKSE